LVSFDAGVLVLVFNLKNIYINCIASKNEHIYSLKEGNKQTNRPNRPLCSNALIEDLFDSIFMKFSKFNILVLSIFITALIISSIPFYKCNLMYIKFVFYFAYY